MNTDTMNKQAVAEYQTAHQITPQHVRQYATFPQFCHTLADLLNAEDQLALVKSMTVCETAPKQTSAGTEYPSDTNDEILL